jgi:alcohol dehydrogenase (cytochrome c)
MRGLPWRKAAGGAGLTLVGNQFFLRYRGKPLSALWSTIHTEMPLNAPGTLSSAQSLALVAFVLHQNGFPAGPSPIVGHYDTMRIIPATAPGASGAAVAARATQGPMIVRQPSTNVLSQQELDDAAASAGDWLMYGKDYQVRVIHRSPISRPPM